MKVSVEMSLYPLIDNYEEVIIKFIERLKTKNSIEVIVNGMSTQIFGDYDEVMQIIQEELKDIFEDETAILIMKIGKGTLKL